MKDLEEQDFAIKKQMAHKEKYNRGIGFVKEIYEKRKGAKDCVTTYLNNLIDKIDKGEKLDSDVNQLTECIEKYNKTDLDVNDTILGKDIDIDTMDNDALKNLNVNVNTHLQKFEKAEFWDKDQKDNYIKLIELKIKILKKKQNSSELSNSIKNNLGSKISTWEQRHKNLQDENWKPKPKEVGGRRRTRRRRSRRKRRRSRKN